MNFSKATLLTTALFALALSHSPASTNQQASVGGNVIGDCTTVPASGLLAFGSYNPFSSSDLAPSTPFQFSINCTRDDTSLAVSVGGGKWSGNANPSGYRAMQDAGGHYLTYQLYEDSAHATAWPFTSGGTGTAVPLTAGGITSANIISLYGVIPHGQTSGPDVGSYTDTVIVTVNY